ncbi:hypothetical protein BDZ94DRAFT_1239720 [Collybia nuda]|uniref:Uncharacterized protein n=1 Tax=Collybia nuda TaxID=64659 RepID=A0A9P6CE57_9AGAR|nr:hypothetical protein BDZ94DRAFT_1239720 [Collybia nuda]
MSEKLGQLSYADGKLLCMIVDGQDLGSMSDDGYYTFTARYTMPLTYSQNREPPEDYPGPSDTQGFWTPGAEILSADGTEWGTQNCDLSSETLGIYLGEVSYPDGTYNLFIIIKRHGENRYHRVTYFALPRSQEYVRKSVVEQLWTVYTYYGVRVSIGGPEEIPHRKPREQAYVGI